MPLRQSTVIDYVAGRLDAHTARLVENAAQQDIRVASAIVEAHALIVRMRGRLALRETKPLAQLH